MDLGWQDLQAESADFGLYLDYQLSWQDYSCASASSGAALLQPVVFGKLGSLSANSIYRYYSAGDTVPGQSLDSGLSILELTYTRDDPEKLRSLRIGDVFTRPGAHGRSLRIGGIQLATNGGMAQIYARF